MINKKKINNISYFSNQYMILKLHHYINIILNLITLIVFFTFIYKVFTNKYYTNIDLIKKL